MRFLLITILLLSFNMRAWEAILEGKFEVMGGSTYSYNFDSDRSLLIRTWSRKGETEIETYSFKEDGFTVTIYRSDATCKYNKEVIGSVIHLIINDGTTGDSRSCNYSYQLVRQ